VVSAYVLEAMQIGVESRSTIGLDTIVG